MNYPLIWLLIQESFDDIAKSGAIALQIPEIATDKIIIVLEIVEHHKLTMTHLKELAVKIFELVDVHFDLFIERILFIPQNQLAKTSSRKLARHQITQQILDNTLHPFFVWKDEDFHEKQLLELVAR